MENSICRAEMEKKKPVYHAVNVYVPQHTREKLMKAVTKSGPVSVRLDLTEEPRDKVYVTWGQRKKIEEAMEKRRKELTLRFSVRQARHNIQSEGGFLGAMMAAATRFLPAILAGILAGSTEHESEGNGMFLGKDNHTYRVRRHAGDGLVIKQVLHQKIQGFYIKHKDSIYQGRGILHNILGQIPLLNILF